MSYDCTCIDILTQDLITEIFVRLPVKTLLCCKSVRKPWLSLISSPNFINTQLRSKPEGGTDKTFIVHEEYEDDDLMSLLNLDSPQVKAPLGFPFSRGDYSFKPGFIIVGSFNGIVCVYVSNSPRSRAPLDLEWFQDNPNTYIWNPATKHSKLIPPPIICGDVKYVSLGFGFDPIGNDFKLLRFVFSRDKTFSADVYSANANVWRKVDPRPTDYPYSDAFDVCVNGFLCFKGSFGNGMMAFDLNTDLIACGIQLPATSVTSTTITDFNDSIAVITSKGYKFNLYDLWTLDDEACLRGGQVEASWTLRLSIDVDFLARLPFLPARFVPRVYDCFNSCDFVFCTGYGVCLLYNSHTKEARNVPISNFIGRGLIKYNESLVSITGSKQVHWNAHDNDI